MHIFRSNLLSYEPQAGFRFLVEVDNRRVGAFTDCTLPKISWKTQEVKEGGLNTHTHQLIGQRKKAKLTLKRGVAVTADLTDWYMQILNQQVSRRRVTVTLLNAARNPVISWFIEDAYPIKWAGPKLQTKGKAVAVETLTLSCGRITVESYNNA
ncbi:MAG: phage tail protein [Chloroflexi bacterium]|nr:phage tail protein [Chloroflexota bacterium]